MQKRKKEKSTYDMFSFVTPWGGGVLGRERER